MKTKALLTSALIVLLLLSCDTGTENDDIPLSEKTIFFASYIDNGEIYRMTPDGEGQEKFISNGIYPRISPSGEYIVYVSFADGAGGEIWISDIDGSNQVQLTDNDYEDNRPVFSPDGTKILYESEQSGNFDIYTMDLSGGNVTQLTTSTSDDQRAEFSPDGTKINFTRIDSISTIYVADSDGQNAVDILSGNNLVWSWGGHWSPDGTKIAFTDYRDGQDPYNVICTIDSDGTDFTILYETENAQEPFFSSDGTEIVYVGYENNQRQIFSMDSDGSSNKRILATGYNCFQPFWFWY